MAGFRSPLFVLSLSSGGERAGYRSALPVPIFGVPDDTPEQVGFRGPLPIPSLGAGGEERAGFITPLPFYFGYAGEPIDPPIIIPEKRRGGGGYGGNEEDDILAVVLAVAQRRGYGGFFGVIDE